MGESDDQKRQEALARFRATVEAALPQLTEHKGTRFDLWFGDQGLPHQIDFERPPGADGGQRPPEVFTFFDDRDLRRLLMAIGRKRLGHIERDAAALSKETAQVKALAEAQAAALAELESQLSW